MLSNNQRTNIVLLCILFQLIILFGIYMFSRSQFTFIFSVISYIPSLFVLLFSKKRKLFLLSVSLLFFSQHSLFLSAQPLWGYASGSDSISDLNIALNLNDQSHFEFGDIGYSRTYYSFYPVMHIFAVILSKISAISIMSIAKFVVPIINAILSSVSLYLLYGEIIADEKLRRLAVLTFSISWYYTLFHANFLREAYAFPISLLIIYSYIKILNKKYEYMFLTYVLFISLAYTHHVTTYMTIIISAVLFMGHYMYEKQTRGLYPVLFMIVILLISTAEIYPDVTINYLLNTVLSLENIFQTGTLTILPHRSLLTVLMSYSYYGIVGLVGLLGARAPNFILKMKETKERVYLPFILLFCILFIASVLLRISATAQWSYYMSHRAIIWAFLGGSILVVYGVDFLSSFISNKNLKYILVISIFCILAIGKFSQYPLVISDNSISQPVSFLRFQSALWLKENAIEGSLFLISYSGNVSNSPARHMSPYSNLRNYNLDWRNYEDFYGYMPFVGPFYSQYVNSPNVAVIYSNGEISIGYKSNFKR